MKIVYNHCAGLDVHKKTVVARVLAPEREETRTFGTTTRRLQELALWLRSAKVTHVAMESTGVYWKPIWNLLERETDCELMLVNAKHIKQVPGRKTDVKDAEWIAELLQHGLLSASYVPSQAHRELRELTRFRRTVIQQRARLIQRLQKVLEGANVKLESVISDVLGVSGKAMIKAMIEGETNPERLASLAHPRLEASPDQLCEALEGVVGKHQRILMDSIVRQVDMLDGEIAHLDRVVAERMETLVAPDTDSGAGSPLPSPPKVSSSPKKRSSKSAAEERATGPVTDAVIRLDEIPGIANRSAQDLLAEIGLDMSPFPTAGQFTSWAKVCPGNNESGGKRRSGRTGKGNKWLRSILVDVAWAAIRKKGCYYGDLYRRLSGRRGGKRAIVAVAHSMLEAIYHMLKRGERYRELGAQYLDESRKEKVVHNAVRRLNRLGFHVTLGELQPSA